VDFIHSVLVVHEAAVVNCGFNNANTAYENDPAHPMSYARMKKLHYIISNINYETINYIINIYT